MTSLPRVALACLALALGGAFAAGCGDDDDKSADTPAALPAPAETTTQETETAGGGEETTSTKPVVVTMKGNVNTPGDITVKVGQKIEWKNEDGYAHNVTSTSGEKIESGNFTDKYEYAPKAAGAIAYVCTIHSGQGGNISVE